MRIMRGDRIVARQHKSEKTGLPVFRAEPGLTCWDTPLSLFGYKKTEVTMQEFVDWVTKRCFPEERVDAQDVLREIGLEKYDAWEIVKRTNAVLTGFDDFWVDFDRN